MVSTYYKTDSYIDDLLQDVLKYGERMTKERPSSYYEMVGRLFIMFGVISTTAGELYYQEKESRRTLLAIKKIDYHRRIVSFNLLHEGLKGILGAVPLFRDRDYQKYPQVDVDDVLSVREEFKCLEQLPECGQGKAKKTNFDATALAYKMFDMIFLGLKGILMLLQSLHDDQQMLHANPEKRVQRWNRMMEDYREREWEEDKLLLQERLDSHIRQHGRDKASLTRLMNQIDNEATNQLLGGMVTALNRHFLNQKDHITYVFDNRDKLTQEQINSHLRFVHIHQLLEQEIALCDLRQPAIGAYADLFTCRAAQEMAELLAPTIARFVDFKHNYHYAAWAMAMKDAGLIYANRRNGTAMVRFINEAFREQVDKPTLFRYLNKDDDFEKIKDQYEVIHSIIDQALGRASEKDYFCQEDHLFFERLAVITKAM